MKPRTVQGVDIAFGPRNLAEFMPRKADIPTEFYNGSTKWNQLFSDWFYSGLNGLDGLIAKEGVDKSAALAHIRCIMGSFEPKHEDKEEACAYLFSIWLEDSSTWTRKDRK